MQIVYVLQNKSICNIRLLWLEAAQNEIENKIQFINFLEQLRLIVFFLDLNESEIVDVSSSNNPLDTCAEVCLRVTSCIKFFYNVKEKLCRYATFYIDHVKRSVDISEPGLLMYTKNRTMASNFFYTIMN